MALLPVGIIGERANLYYRGVAQLVARVVWDHQAAGSNPVTPTKYAKPSEIPVIDWYFARLFVSQFSAFNTMSTSSQIGGDRNFLSPERFGSGGFGDRFLV